MLFVMNLNKYIYRLRFLIFIVISISWISCNLKSSEQYFIEAEDLAALGYYKEANHLLDKAIKKNNRFLEAYISRGANKAELKSFQEAIKDYEKVLTLDPQNTLALFNIANNYKRLERYDVAIRFYNKAFDSKGGEKMYLDHYLNHFINSEDFDVPGYIIHFERGIAHYYKGNIEKAFSDFNISIKNDYKIGECYYWIGYIHISKGEMKLACESLNKAMQMGDQDAQLALNRYCK